MDQADKTKRIAQNTLMLYVRMLFTMGVSLYTSRVVLEALGIEDFGIYNVVGGVVSLFSILSGSLSAAISRFITFELGKENQDRLRNIFSSAITIQLILGLLIALFAETIGGWFLNNKMNIPMERMVAANWLFQFSIITFVINLLSVPYNAALIAHERMTAFAYISVLEVVGKLLVVYLLQISPVDKLIFYAFLMCMVSLVVRFVYGVYCKRHFMECRYRFIWDTDLLKQMFNFAGWNFIGSSSAILRDQGGNILINLFFGSAVNAARGIAIQVNSAVWGFANNFMTALNPQITKSYASGDYGYMMMLIYKGARLSFYMLLFLSLPLLVCTDYVLAVWLTTVPDYTVVFVRLVLLFALSESISYPLITAMLATGRIRNYQLIVGGLQMMNLPISYVVLQIGGGAEMVFIVAIIISQCCLIARLFLLRGMIGLVARDYLKNVYLNVLFVSFSSAVFPIGLSLFLPKFFYGFIVLCLISWISSAVSIFYIGCNKEERLFVETKIQAVKLKMIGR